MRKLIGAVACAAVMMVSGVAKAAAVDIVFDKSDNSLTLLGTQSNDVGYLSLVIDGATSFVPGPSVSALDSVLDVTQGFAIIVSPAGAALANPVGTLTFATSPGACGPLSSNSGTACTVIRQDVDLLGPAVLSVAGTEISDFSISVVPEPSTLALLGLGLAGLALVRRTA